MTTLSDLRAKYGKPSLIVEEKAVPIEGVGHGSSVRADPQLCPQSSGGAGVLTASNPTINTISIQQTIEEQKTFIEKQKKKEKTYRKKLEQENISNLTEERVREIITEMLGKPSEEKDKLKKQVWEGIEALAFGHCKWKELGYKSTGNLKLDLMLLLKNL